MTAENLKVAIEAADLNQVRVLLQMRNAHGAPLININTLHPDGYGDTTFFYTTAFNLILGRNCFRNSTQNTRYEMLMAVLSARDNNNNPLIDLNVQLGGCGGAGLEALLSEVDKNRDFLALHQLRGIVDTVINLRSADGCRFCDLNFRGFIGLLNQAILFGDSAIVQSLIDLRNGDGSFAIDINKTLFWGGDRYNPLDVAYRGTYWGGPNNIRRDLVNPQIIALLIEAGARRYGQPALQQNPDRIVRAEAAPVLAPVAVHVAVENANREVDQFNDNAQNVHTPQTERTVDLSIAKLIARYPNVNSQQAFDEIRAFMNLASVKKLYSAKDFKNIKLGFEFVQKNSVANSIHAPTGKTMQDILALVWAGAKDANKNALPQEQKEVTDGYIRMRKMALLDQFKEIATTYPGRESPFSCIGGTRNRLITALNKAHCDVAIASTKSEVAEIALAEALRFEKEALMKLPVDEQRKILASWGAIEEAGPARDFHYSLQAGMRALLQNSYGNIMDQSSIEEIVGDTYFPLLRRPAVHPELDAFLTELEGKIGFLAPMIKEVTQQVFLPGHTYEEDYTRLQSSYSPCAKLREKWSNIQTTHASNKKDAIHDEAFKKIAAEIATIAEDTSVPFDERCQKIEENMNSLAVLDNMAKNILGAIEKYNGNNAQRKLQLSKVVISLQDVYLHRNKYIPLKKSLERLSGTLAVCRDRAQKDHLENGRLRFINRALSKLGLFSPTRSRLVKLLDTAIVESKQIMSR